MASCPQQILIPFLLVRHLENGLALPENIDLSPLDLSIRMLKLMEIRDTD